MTNIKAPCKDCQNRQLGCHGSCQAYLDYDSRNKQINVKKLNDQIQKIMADECLCKASRAKQYMGW